MVEWRVSGGKRGAFSRRLPGGGHGSTSGHHAEKDVSIEAVIREVRGDLLYFRSARSVREAAQGYVAMARVPGCDVF